MPSLQTPPPPAESETVARPRRPIPATTVTQIGGLLFLLPLALRLDLYADFSRPLDLGLPVSPWDFLTLMGVRLLDQPHTGDRIWPLLAHLADRPPRTAPHLEGADAIADRLRHQLEASLGPRWPRLLLRRPARLSVSPGRLDATFALRRHPPAVRLAGLDRDPGWLPAAGREIAFHFET